MKPSEALRTHRQAIRDIVARHLARNARVFGSVAPGATLLDLGALQVELEEALGLQVDLLTPGDLPPKFRERVLREAVVV